MPRRKRQARGTKRCKVQTRKREATGKKSAVAEAEPDALAQARPRIRLRTALRAAGLDEWRIAWILSKKVESLSESKVAGDKRLLLDYMKEAIRHLDPAAAAAAVAQESAMVEMTHSVERPDRGSCITPAGAGAASL